MSIGQKDELVSVIVPCFNVEKYVSCCLNSIINQTYKYLEIIVIDDASSDNTLQRCYKAACADERIKVISNDSNKGLGPTRNLGLQIAEGKYVTYVDSDDFLPPNAIELLHKEISEKGDVDVVAGNYEELDDNTGGRRLRSRAICKHEELYRDSDKARYLFSGWVMVWGKLYRRDFLLDNEINMPRFAHEDNAIFPMISLLAKGIVTIEEPVYIYRINRMGSITGSNSHSEDTIKACLWFCDYFKERNLFNKYYYALKRYAEWKLFDTAEKHRQENNYQEYEKRIKETYELDSEYFGGKKAYFDHSYALIGGFGCRYVIQMVCSDLHKLEKHWAFASIISLMSRSDTNIYPRNNNKFRDESIRADFSGGLYNYLTKEERLADYLVIDFIEERFPIAILDDGNMITVSDAFLETGVKLNIANIIKPFTESYWYLWKDKCDELKKLLKAREYQDIIILIRSRFAYKKDLADKLLDYDNKDKLKEWNDFIRKLENYFCDGLEGIRILEYEDELISTDQFKYGAEPQYYSEYIYNKMVQNVIEDLESL